MFLYVNVGLIAVETTVCVIVELMWSVVSQYPDILCFCIPHLIKLLTAAVSINRQTDI